MPTVSDICHTLENIAPTELAEDWDNVGLLVGRKNAAVCRVMTCLTLTSNVAEEAVQKQVNMIVSHHPILFSATKNISDKTPEGEILLRLIENTIAVYSPHTCYDSAFDGINQQLASAFALSDIQPLRQNSADHSVGSGRQGRLLTEVSLQQFLGTVAGITRASHIEYTGRLDATVRKVGVACGAAGEFLRDAAQHGCDTFVTGETRFHTAIASETMNINLIIVGHYCSERPAIEYLATKLKQQFPALEVFPSQNEHNPLTVYIP